MTTYEQEQLIFEKKMHAKRLAQCALNAINAEGAIGKTFWRWRVNVHEARWMVAHAKLLNG